MQSEPGDGIGGGKTYSFPESAGTFTVEKNSGNGVSVSFIAPGYTQSWSLDFAAPGRVLLQAGAYPGATRFPFNHNGEPGLDVTGNSGGSNELTGSFVVKDIAYGTGNVIERFWAVFEQHSEGAPAALTGEIRYHVDVVMQVSTPIEKAVDFDHDLDFAVTAMAAGGLTTTLSAANLPAGATFTDLGNNTGMFHWRPTLSQSAATYHVTFSANNGAGSTDTTTTAIEVRGMTRLTIRSELGDPIGRGGSYDFGPQDGTFTASTSSNFFDGDELTIHVSRPGYADSWTLSFLLRTGEPPLTTGVYTGSGWNPATLEVTHGYTDFGTKLGNFQVKEIAVESGKVRKFWATFEQYAGTSRGLLKGEIKFNIPTAFDVSAPITAAVPAGATLEVPISATGGAGTTFALSALNLPAGAVFTDHGDNTGVVRWPTSAGDIGVHRVTFQAQDAGGAVRSATTAIDVKGFTSLKTQTSANHFATIERSYDLPESAGVFRLTKNEGAGISIIYTPDSGSRGNSWYLTFAAPGKAKLSPGLYRGAMGSLPSDAAPTLIVREQSQYLYGLSGIFEVKEIAYGPDDTLTKFRATFEQDNIGASDVRGEIRFNATNGPTMSAPLQQVARFGNAIDFDVTASDPANGTLVLGAMNLPDGSVFTDRGDGTGHFHWATDVSKKGPHTVTFKVTTSTGASDTARTAVDVNGVMALTLNSQQGDPVGSGKDYRLGPDQGHFTATKNELNGVTISFASEDPAQSWTLTFGAPGNVPLTAGAYPDATRYFGQVSTSPGMFVSGSGYSGVNTITGGFVIKEIVEGVNGTIESFWATFEQHADGRTPALAGEIKFNLTAPVQFSSPSLVTAEYGSALDFTVSALSTTGGVVTLSVGTLPPGARFTDHGDGTGTLHWQPSFAQVGQYAITFTARNAAGETDTFTTSIAVAGITSLVMESEPGDDVGAGKTYHFPRTAGRFTAWKYGGAGVAVNFFNETNSWDLVFRAPDGSTLAPGIYTGAVETRYGSKPGIYVRGLNGSTHQQTGAFRIKQLEYGPNDSIASFWAIFEQHDQGADPALLGEIKYNATAADNVAISAPFETRIQYGETFEFDVSASAAAGGAITLSAPERPAGSEFTDHGNGSATFRWTPGLTDRGTRTLTFTARNAAGDVDTTTTAVEVRGDTSLVMQSDQGDYIGSGKSYFFAENSGTFSVSTNPANGVSVNFHTNGYKEAWALQFAAARNVPLQPGTYPGAIRFPSQNTSAPELSVTGNGRGSNTLTGTFTVKQIESDADGTINSFWVLFEQHSEGGLPALTGEFQYNAWPVRGVSAPSSRTVSRGHPVEFRVAAVGPNGDAFTLEASHLPPGATFTDLHNNIGVFRWQTATAAMGRYAVTFTARPASGTAQTAETRIDVRGVTSLAMRSAPGESVGQGQSYYFPETAGGFAIGQNYDNGVSISYSGENYLTDWRLDFAAPESARLQPGTYTGARRFPYQDRSEPGLEVSGAGRRSNLLTGSFTVKQVVYGTDDTITSFWATFVQHDGASGPALFGEIKFNADAPDLPEIPDSEVCDWRQVKGTFRGMAGNLRSLSFDASGPVEMTVSKTGVVTGKVRLGSQTYYFRGPIDDAGYAMLSARSHDGLTSVTITLQVNRRGDRYYLAGEITKPNGFSSNFTAGRASPSPTGAFLPGKYTFILRPPNGDLVGEGGWGTIVVGKTGALRMVGTTADGRPFDTTALPNEDGSWPVFFQPIFLAGNLSGVLTPADLANSDLSGILAWFRPLTEPSPFQTELESELILEASRYVPAHPALQLPHGSARIEIEGNASTSFAESVSPEERTSRVFVFGANPKRLTLYANGRNGTIRGTFLNASNRWSTLRGIIYQKTNRGQGSFSGGRERGAFTLVPE